MPQLLLIRHAKAATFGAEPGDHGRPLSDKGHRHARQLGVLLRDADWVPDLAIVSSAERARQTWGDMCAVFGECPARFEEKLYLASPKTLMAQIAAHSGAVKRLALIGHNPGIGMLADHLVDTGFDHQAAANRALAMGFKTGWAAAFDLREEGPRLAQVFDPRL